MEFKIGVTLVIISFVFYQAYKAYKEGMNHYGRKQTKERNYNR